MSGFLVVRSGLVMLAFAGLALGSSRRIAWGQPVGDGSLNTQVNASGSLFEITGGQQAGPNLFHSFQQFDLPGGSTAQFAPAPVVEAIFGRITDGSASEIGGRIQVLGNADLFLFNPNGFVFEAGSSLALNGDFTLGAADSIRFANGDRFFANPAQPSILSISAPLGLGNITAGKIENQANLSAGGIFTLAAGSIDGGGDLSSDAGQLQLVSLGGVKQAELTAEAIAVEAQGDTVFETLIAPQFVTVSTGGDLDILQGIRTFVNQGDAGPVELVAGGAIAVGGTITNRSAAPVGNSGSVRIQAGGDVSLNQIQTFVGENTQGNSGDVNVVSGGILTMVDGGIATFKRSSAMGNGGDIRLEARDISLAGTRLQSSNQGAGLGRGGDVELRALDRIQLRSSPANLARILSHSQSGSLGDSGSILLQAGQIELVDAVLDSQMRGAGRGGDITLRATNPLPLGQENQITLAGDRANSKLLSRLTGQGLAGDIRLETQSLLLADGAQISSVTEGQGDAGSIAIQAGIAVLEDNSIIQTGNNRRTTVGNGGELSIETAQLTLQTGGSLQSASQGQGDAGDIVIEASEVVTINGENASGAASSLKASVTTSGLGQAGRIAIKTEDFLLNNSAQIQSNGENSGALPGQIEITARDVLLTNGVRVSADVRNSGSGDGGPIAITAERIRANGNSDITAQPRGGDLGLITLKAQSVDGLQPSDRLTAENDLVGNVTIEILPNSPPIPVEPPEEPPSEPQNPNEPIVPSEEPTVPNGPTLPAEPNEPATEPPQFEPGNPLPEPTNPLPEQPSLEPNAGALPLTSTPNPVPLPEIVSGPAMPELLIVTPRPLNLNSQDESDQNLQRQIAVLGRAGEFAIPQLLGCGDSEARLRLIGRGGLSDAAHRLLSGRSLWSDSRAAAMAPTMGLTLPEGKANSAGLSTFQEATTWQVNGDRQVQLVANRGLASGQRNCAELSVQSPS